MKTFKQGLLVLLVGALAGCGQQLVEFGGNPTVSSTDPLNAAVNVGASRTVNATFSEAMDPATLTAATFTLQQGTTAIAGAVTYAGLTATFTPSADLSSNVFTATVSTGAKSMSSGNALASPYTWSFTTSSTGSAPQVTSTDPGNSSTGVAVNKQVSATFNRAMDAATITAATFTLKQGANPVAGAVSYAGTTALFVPSSLLGSNLLYDATITVGARDPGGSALAADYKWSFTTGSGPVVIAVDPLDNATNVATNTQVRAVFNKAMDPNTLTGATFTLKQGLNPVAGLVSYAGNTATFAPSNPLASNTLYSATVTTGAKDTTGIALAVNFPWSFTTAAVPPPPLAINLGAAATFGLASQAGLTSTGVTVVNGDVALFPTATCSDATGNAGASQTCLSKIYTSPTGMTVNGSIYWAGDPFDNGGTAHQVTNDLNTAWVQGKNKIDTQLPIPGDQMDLKTFNAGVYHNANLGLAAGGTATLDGQNDSNAVFIFKVDSTFVDSGTLLLPSKIVLVNGAQARNIWFVTGLDATIGSGTQFNGNILAGRTVTVKDGSTVNGRVLAGASGAGALTLTGAASPSVTTVTVPQ
jgi:ice-binding like protein/Big-like domain-containing protein